MSAALIVAIIAAYLICGIYITGRFGYSHESEHPGVMFCPFFWPIFLLVKFIHAVWVLGFKRRF